MNDVERYNRKSEKNKIRSSLKIMSLVYQTFEFKSQCFVKHENVLVWHKNHIAKKLRTKKSAISRIENHFWRYSPFNPPQICKGLSVCAFAYRLPNNYRARWRTATKLRRWYLQLLNTKKFIIKSLQSITPKRHAKRTRPQPSAWVAG